jgi:class 3 adenylate cyclase/predicted negative regulator of RcsB-dependent stress response
VKRKIAVILAADIAGYSRLIAEDEEETLRRFEGYRTVFSEFVDRGGGRIFNTAGDAILAEFQSAVEAVRCAIDVQESLHARNLAYPESRHMNFRIGITIGDVVERENGDLLGDGVNIAARLESVAPPGGICVSRAVHEAVASKMALRFADAGPQALKNIPERIHAYTLTLEESQPAAVVTQKSEPVAARVLAAGRSIAGQLRAHGTTVALALMALVVAGIYAYEYLPQDTAEVADAPASAKPSASGTTTVAAAPDTSSEAQPETRSDPAPEKDIETAAKSPEPDPDMVRKAPSPLASRYVLSRQWKDCDETVNTDIALDACKGLLDTGGLNKEDQATIRYKYARALRDKGNPDAAIASYDRSIELNPSAEAYNHRGVAYFDKGEYARAIDDYNEALRLKPSDADALNNRAWTRYKSGDLNAALQDANRAISLDGTKAYIWDTRGHINEQRGARSAAISDYRKALDLDRASDSSSEGLRRLGAN